MFNTASTTIAALDRVAAIPSEFVCPLTLELMECPMMSRSGQVFERCAILEWLGRGNERCPISRRPMSLSDLLPHRALQARIFQWKIEHGLVEAPFEGDESSSSSGMMMEDYNTPSSPVFVPLTEAEFERHIEALVTKASSVVDHPPPVRRRGVLGRWWG